MFFLRRIIRHIRNITEHLFSWFVLLINALFLAFGLPFFILWIISFKDGLSSIDESAIHLLEEFHSIGFKYSLAIVLAVKFLIEVFDLIFYSFEEDNLTEKWIHRFISPSHARIVMKISLFLGIIIFLQGVRLVFFSNAPVTIAH